MLIMTFANGGDLHNYLQKNFDKVTWQEKLYILWNISLGYLFYINLYLYIYIYIFLINQSYLLI